MDIESFWNQAFISALSRLPAEEAKQEADKAIKLCIEHWQSLAFERAPFTNERWQKQDVGAVPEVILRIPIKRKGNVVAFPGYTEEKVSSIPTDAEASEPGEPYARF